MPLRDHARGRRCCVSGGGGTALDEVDRIEDELSVFRATSAVSEVNRRASCGAVAVPSDLFDLLAVCRRLHQDTGGAFDITSTPLSRCWGFLRREGRLPAPDAIAAARAMVGFDAVRLGSADAPSASAAPAPS